MAIESQAEYIQQFTLEKSINIRGIGDEDPMYFLEPSEDIENVNYEDVPFERVLEETNLEKWLSHIKDPYLRVVATEGLRTSYHFLLTHRPQEAKSKIDASYFAHGYRAMRILIDEMGITNDVVILTTLMHDAVHVLGKEKVVDMTEYLKNNLRKASTECSNEIIQEKLDALVEVNFIDYFDYFHEMHKMYMHTIDTVIKDLEKDLSSAEEFTPDRYRNFRQKVIKMYVHTDEYIESIRSRANELEKIMIERALTKEEDSELSSLYDEPYLERQPQFEPFGNLYDILHQHQREFKENGETYLREGRPVSIGFATKIARIAAAIDNSRYRRQVSPRHDRIRFGIDASMNLIPIAKALEIQPAVRMLNKIIATSFMPSYWNGLVLASQKMSEQIFSMDTMGGGYFDTLLQRNLNKIKKEISNQLEKRGLVGQYISEEEFLARRHKILRDTLDLDRSELFENGYLEEILAPHEYTILSDKKTLGSIFNKWFKEYTAKKISRDPSYSVSEYDKDSVIDNWIEYLLHSTDLLRAKLVTGEALSKCLPELILEESDFDYSETSPLNGRRRNLYRTKRLHSSHEAESNEWRVWPYSDPKSKRIFFEHHLVLKMKEETKLENGTSVTSLPFELHSESIAQHWLNVYEEEAHVIYKLMEDFMSPRDQERFRNDPEFRGKIVQLHKRNQIARQQLFVT